MTRAVARKKGPTPLRVLLVENDPGRLTDLRRRLALHRVTVAMDYTSAISAMRNTHRFDLVLLDHDINGRKNGCDLAFWMRRLPVRRRPERVLVHAWSRAGALAIAITLRSAGLAVTVEPYEQVRTSTAGRIV